MSVFYEVKESNKFEIYKREVFFFNIIYIINKMQAEIPPEVFYSNMEKVRQIWANVKLA